MTVADWEQIDATVTSLPTNVSENDLFAADLFGSEIIEMYGGSVEVNDDHGDTGTVNAHEENAMDDGAANNNNDNSSTQVPVESGDNTNLERIDGLHPDNDMIDFTNLLPPLASPPALPQMNKAETDTASRSPLKRTHSEANEQPQPLTAPVIPTLAPVPVSEEINTVATVTSAPAPIVQPTTPLQAPAPAPIQAPAPAPAPIQVASSTTTVTATAPAKAPARKNPKTPRSRKTPILKNGVITPSAVLSSNSITGQAAAFIMRQKQLKNQGLNPTSIISPLSTARSGTTTPPSTTPSPSFPTVVSPTTATPIPYLHSDSATATAAAVAAAARPKTEADFAAVAQAAVSSLILSAGANAAAQQQLQNITDEDSDERPETTTAAPFSFTIDTSTAHIAALTSSNWMQACGANATLPTVNGTVTAAEDEPLNKKRRENLTPDERAKQNRVRNREHARNTRLRKKAYVEELKRTLTELVAQRDASELERRQNAQRELEQREVRFRVMEEFLRLRGGNEGNVSRWVAILEDEFELKLPVTGYRSMVADNVGDEGETHEQVLRGATEAMADAACLGRLLEVVFGDVTGGKPKVYLNYECNRKRFFMDGITAMLDWTATSVGGVNQGATSELLIKGTMKAVFSPASNKLISADIMFDTGFVLGQIKSINPNICDLNTNTTMDMSDEMSPKDANALIDSIQMPCFLTSTLHTQDKVAPPAFTVSEQPDVVESNDTAHN